MNSSKLSIKNLAAWTANDLAKGIMRQSATLTNCRLALEALNEAHCISQQGRDPRLNILLLAGDSLARTAKLQAEALSRGMDGQLAAMKSEGFRLDDADGFFAKQAAILGSSKQ